MSVSPAVVPGVCSLGPSIDKLQVSLDPSSPSYFPFEQSPPWRRTWKMRTV